MSDHVLTPKEFLKSRRPERFSDSQIQEATRLDRSLLEYHLDSLTSRGQETDFEHFAKRLCEVEVCPNLMPHTGPDAGGDAKADSQTYPVAEALAATWYVGLGTDSDTDAAGERWAFAFSTQQKWRDKVNKDFAKIVATGRGYARAFFVSNQAIPDKDRASAEDALSKTHGLPVTIFGRTWILDKVFANGRESIAIEELGITGLSTETTRRKGALDTEREVDLADAEARIQAAAQSGFTTAAVDDAILAGIIARELDHPQAEIEGRFGRAQKLARKFGTPRQQVEAAYQWAWTLNFYIEDVGELPEAYDAVATLVDGSLNVRDLEQLSNLWTLLYTAVGLEMLPDEEAGLDARRQVLYDNLDRLAAEHDRPSTALQARVLRINLDLLTRSTDPAPLFEELGGIVRQAEHLVGFPFDPIVRIFAEEGAAAFEGTPGYDDFFDLLVEVASAREGETKGASLLLNRGRAQIENDEPMSAVATLGRALSRLSKDEARDEFAEALYLSGHGLDAIGLPWASRGLLLAAATVSIDERWRYGKVTVGQASAFRRLKWVELRLGRIPQALAWHQADLETRDYLVKRGEGPEQMARLHREFDHMLGTLLLTLRPDQYAHLQALPDTLFSLDLRFAAIALLFVLGHTSPMEALAESQGEPGDSADTFASRWVAERPADWQNPAHPHLYVAGESVELVSRVSGCEVRISSDPDPHCVNVSEAVLGAIEGLLATTPVARTIPREATFTISVHSAVEDSDLLTIRIDDQDGIPHADIYAKPFAPNALTLDEQRALKRATFEAVISIMPRIVTLRDAKRDLKDLFEEERALDRAIFVSGAYGAQVNVLGASPMGTLDYWQAEDAETYEILRSEPWVPIDVGAATHQAEPSSPVAPPPARSTVRHQDISTISYIREALWDRAGWLGTSFMVDPSGTGLPVLGLIFEDIQAGETIYRGWREEFGDADDTDRLRVAIIRGFSREAPYAYRMSVGTNPLVLDTSPSSAPFVALHARLRTMSSPDGQALNLFLRAYHVSGAYLLAPAAANAGGPPLCSLDVALLKHKLAVRPAWQVGPDDIDCTMIFDDDDVIVPSDVADPPVQELLKQRTAGAP